MKQKLLIGLGAILFFVTAVAIPVVFAQGVQNQELDQSVTAEDQATGKVIEQQLEPSKFKSATPLRRGTIVQTADSPDSVKPATRNEVNKAFGVVINFESPLLITGGENDDSLYIANSGRQFVIVSTENGPIEAGDYLAVSALSGTLMKAGDDQERVFAQALQSFDGKGTLIHSTTLKDQDGRPFKEVAVSEIEAMVEVKKNPNQVSTASNVPQWLQRVGQQIANSDEPIVPFRLYLSAAIAVISTLIALVALYSGIRSAIVAIGRNPLSKKSIFRGLLEVILTSILVLLIGAFAVYLVIRL